MQSNPRRHRSVRSLCFLLLLAILPTGAGLVAQQAEDGAGDEPRQEVNLVLSPNQRPLLRLAFPTPTGLGQLGAARAAGTTLEQTLRRDLEVSGHFALQGPSELGVLALTGDRSRDHELYRSLGNEMLLDVTLKEEPQKIILEGRVIDLKSGQQILGKLYRGEHRVARRIAHSFADEIVRYFTGRPGIAMTSIAFYSDRSGEKEIYLMDYDGSNQRPVTGHRTISMAPTWSPDGQGLTYVSFLRGDPGLFYVDLRTGNKRDLLVDGHPNISPSFSPDGSRLAFARSLEGNTEIFTCRRDGSDLQRLTHARGIDTNPAWSPNGREIAFTSNRSGSPQVYVMDAEGANLRRISFSGQYNEGASWSPDGTRIAYASRQRGGRFQIAITELVTLETTLLTNGAASNEAPAFSPDGRFIAYTSNRGHGPQIEVVDIKGGTPRRLTSEGRNFAPNWSGFSAR